MPLDMGQSITNFVVYPLFHMIAPLLSHLLSSPAISFMTVSSLLLPEILFFQEAHASLLHRSKPEEL